MMQGRRLPLLCLLASTLSLSTHAFVAPSASSLRFRGYNVPRLSSCSWSARSSGAPPTVYMSKGFGPPPPKRDPRPPKSQKRIEREQASKAYEDMAAAGIPEYNIFIKAKGTDDYLPAGVMAVPRSQQVSAAIFEQEENLKAAAFKFFDKLKAYDEFEYGYTLKMFPDDPVTPIEKRAPSTNPVGRFFEGLLSPVNTAGMKGPPVEPPPPPPPTSS